MTIRHSFCTTHLSNRNGVLCDRDGMPFDAVSYSRFKYGWLPPADSYAAALATTLNEQLGHVLYEDRPVYIVSAPYKALPTASHAIAQSLCNQLAIEAAKQRSRPPVVLPFHKQEAGDSRYANSSHEVRLKLLAGLKLHIDEQLVPDSIMLIVDDIRITGTAEAVSADYLESLQPHMTVYLHAARLSQLDAAKPTWEHILNNSAKHGPEDILLDMLLPGNQFQLNTRVLRHMLEWRAIDFGKFLLDVPETLRREIYYGAVYTGSDYCYRYRASLAKLAESLDLPIPLANDVLMHV